MKKNTLVKDINKLRNTFLIIFILTGWQLFAQPVLRKNSNSTLKIYNSTHPSWNITSKQYKWGKSDTLKIPFFDDFVSTQVYPDSTRWQNNYVYINNDFAQNPPSFGVATFDDLDPYGNPYQELNDQVFGACDTLLSLCINLKDSSGVLYNIDDSFYFSFFYQRQGNGDPSDTKDSIILQFKDNAGQWNTMWKARGGTITPFVFQIFPVNNIKYFFKGFQFRFINFSRHTGNMNQWHIDYIHLDRHRQANINYYDDFAVQSKPTSLLKNYSQLPYKHFLADSSNQIADSIFFYASNLHKNGMNIQAKHTETVNGNTIISTNFLSNSANIQPMSNAKRRFKKFGLNTLSGESFKITREYQIIDANFTTLNPSNDKITTIQEFGSCYAYDDGTAEYGFGYNDDVIDPFYNGAIAYKFNLIKADTLWAIGMFFNQSVKSSKYINFDIKGWKKISQLGTIRNDDEELFSIYNQTPKYTDSINGFHIFYLDTPILLPKGDFYIGWEQVGNYHLDVGYDINNGYHQTESSDNLFWSDRGKWQNVTFKGALMMRPYLGKKIIYGNAKISKYVKDKIIVFPNPFENKIYIETTDKLKFVKIFDNAGKLVLTTDKSEIDASGIKAGVYTMQIFEQNSKSYFQKIIKLN
ncbi:MAG: T9SS type A sorting domain-containing protein [Bacteroidetes bacterium]|nr:T9SS type A sorting domain-containing protein [Bacteroidota bacterium]